MSTSLKGVSKLRRDLGITQKTAWMMAQKIREGWVRGSTGPMDGAVEVDETCIGGKRKNMRSARMEGRGAVEAVIGQRGGEVRAAYIGDTTRETVRGFVEGAVSHGSTLYSDEDAAISRTMATATRP